MRFYIEIHIQLIFQFNSPLIYGKFLTVKINLMIQDRYTLRVKFNEKLINHLVWKTSWNYKLSFLQGVLHLYSSLKSFLHSTKSFFYGNDLIYQENIYDRTILIWGHPRLNELTSIISNVELTHL